MRTQAGQLHVPLSLPLSLTTGCAACRQGNVPPCSRAFAPAAGNVLHLAKRPAPPPVPRASRPSAAGACRLAAQRVSRDVRSRSSACLQDPIGSRCWGQPSSFWRRWVRGHAAGGAAAPAATRGGAGFSGRRCRACCRLAARCVRWPDRPACRERWRTHRNGLPATVLSRHLYHSCVGLSIPRPRPHPSPRLQSCSVCGCCPGWASTSPGRWWACLRASSPSAWPCWWVQGARVGARGRAGGAAAG